MAGELRKTALESDDIESELIDVPEWHAKGSDKPLVFEVRGMSSKERSKLLKSATRDGEVQMEQWFPDLIIATVFDPETGEQVFERADRAALNAKSGAVISAIADVSARLSGLGDTDVQAAKEELSGETLNPDST